MRVIAFMKSTGDSEEAVPPTTEAFAAMDRFSEVLAQARVFAIGPFLKRVNFASQQNRALNLTWALTAIVSLTRCGDQLGDGAISRRRLREESSGSDKRSSRRLMFGTR